MSVSPRGSPPPALAAVLIPTTVAPVIVTATSAPSTMRFQLILNPFRFSTNSTPARGDAELATPVATGRPPVAPPANLPPPNRPVDVEQDIPAGQDWPNVPRNGPPT